MKYWLSFLFVALLLCGCSPSESAIQTAVIQTQQADAQTQEAIQTAVAATFAAEPTKTPIPATKTPEPTITPVSSGTLANPYPFNQPIPLTKTVNGNKISLILQITQVIRGQEAWSIIYSANMFNDKPPNGMEALLIEISVENKSTTENLAIDNQDVQIITNGRFIDFYDYHVCCLDSEGLLDFDITLIPGGKASGWIASMVAVDDKSPLLVLGADSDGEGGLYFSLTEVP